MLSIIIIIVTTSYGTIYKLCLHFSQIPDMCIQSEALKPEMFPIPGKKKTDYLLPFSNLIPIIITFVLLTTIKIQCRILATRYEDEGPKNLDSLLLSSVLGIILAFAWFFELYLST